MVPEAPADARPPFLERIESLDVLRGFALLGILIVHFWGEPGSLLPRLDTTLDEGIELLVEESFGPIFAFLFGLGFAVQLQRGRAARRPFIAPYLRRLGALLAIGALHMIFLSDGDILVQYALIGLLILPMGWVPSRWLAGMVVVLACWQLGQATLSDGMERLRGVTTAEIEARQAEEAARMEVAQEAWIHRGSPAGASDTYRDDVTRRVQLFRDTVRWELDPGSIPGNRVLLIFLVGLLLGRTTWLREPRRHRSGWRMTLAGAGTVAAAGLVVDAAADGLHASLEEIVFVASNYGLSVFYVAGIVLLLDQESRPRRMLKVFAPVGRMALTNYLLQSLIMMWPFLPYGLGMPLPSTASWLGLNLIFFFGVQVPFSHAWLRRFRYGPVEWIWRGVTYGTLPSQQVLPAPLPKVGR